MEKIRLNSNQVFVLIPNGIRTSGDSLTIELISDQTINDLDVIFSNEDDTSVIQLLSADEEVVKLYKDYVVCSDITLRKEAVVDYQEVHIEDDTVWEPVYGKCITITLHKKELKYEVTRNRADIEYLAIMNDIEI